MRGPPAAQHTAEMSSLLRSQSHTQRNICIYILYTLHVGIRLKQVHFESCCGSHKINHLSEHQKASSIYRHDFIQKTPTPLYHCQSRNYTCRFILCIHKYERRHKVDSTHDHHFHPFLYLRSAYTYLYPPYLPYLPP